MTPKACEHELISLVIPVYNVKDYLGDCLDSLLAQTYQNFEIVIVDDASTDGSGEIARRYAEQHPLIRVVAHDRNRGLAAARNTGIASACGAYIAFVDSDDYVSPDYLSGLYGNAVAHGADISVCGRYLAFETQKGLKLVEDAQTLFSRRRLSNLEGLRALNSYRAFDMSMCSKLIRKSLFEGIEFPEGKLCEDYFTCHKIVFKATCLYYDPTPLYYYRQRPGSISRGDKVNWAPMEASDEQLRFIMRECPELKWVGETSCAFARVSIINECARRGLETPRAKEIKAYVRHTLLSVLRNGDIPSRKKAQALCFAISTNLYSKIFVSFSSRAKLQDEAAS